MTPEKKKKKLFLEKINSPEDLKSLNIEDLKVLFKVATNMMPFFFKNFETIFI